jgi:hypothetical protein
MAQAGAIRDEEWDAGAILCADSGDDRGKLVLPSMMIVSLNEKEICHISQDVICFSKDHGLYRHANTDDRPQIIPSRGSPKAALFIKRVYEKPSFAIGGSKVLTRGRWLPDSLQPGCLGWRCWFRSSVEVICE